MWRVVRLRVLLRAAADPCVERLQLPFQLLQSLLHMLHLLLQGPQPIDK
jgi:hypothetical protein